MGHYDVDVHCEGCRRYVTYFRDGPDPGPQLCEECRRSGKELRAEVVQGAPKSDIIPSLFAITKRLLTKPANTVVRKEKTSSDGLLNFDHLQQEIDYRSNLIAHASWILQTCGKPESLSHLILCAIKRNPISPQDMIHIARCFGFEDAQEVKSAMLKLSSSGDAKINSSWELEEVS